MQPSSDKYKNNAAKRRHSEQQVSLSDKMQMSFVNSRKGKFKTPIFSGDFHCPIWQSFLLNQQCSRVKTIQLYK